MDFLAILFSLLPLGGMIFAVPDMDYLYNNQQISVMHFEHTFYLSEIYVDYLVSKYGFEIIGKNYFGNGHSIIYTTVYKEYEQMFNLDAGLLGRNEKLLEEWKNKYLGIVQVWNKKMEGIKCPIFLFGAHLSSQLFMAFGLEIQSIEGFLYNDAYKEGKRVSGTNLYVETPHVLAAFSNAVVIVPETLYSSEIKEGIKK